MREEAPLYYNEKYNFYALSRYDDVARELPNWETYRSGRGTTADILFNNIEVPPGILLFEDPPLHDLHRRLLSRVFTPRRMLAVEISGAWILRPELDPLIGAGGFDFIADLGAMMPMRTIGYLLGIPEEDQASIRDRNGAFIEWTRGHKPGEVSPKIFEDTIVMFAEYIEWRAESSVRRPDDRTASGRDGRTRRHAPAAVTHRGAVLYRDDRRCRKRDHRPAHRFHGTTARRITPINAANSPPTRP